MAKTNATTVQGFDARLFAAEAGKPALEKPAIPVRGVSLQPSA